MGLVTKQNEFARMMALLILYAQEREIQVTIGDVYRSEEEQARKLAQGLSKTMDSAHRNRLAVDLNLFCDGKWITDKEHPAFRILGEFWENVGGEWSSRWGIDEADYDTKVGWEAGHFEY